MLKRRVKTGVSKMSDNKHLITPYTKILGVRLTNKIDDLKCFEKKILAEGVTIESSSKGNLLIRNGKIVVRKRRKKRNSRWSEFNINKNLKK